MTVNEQYQNLLKTILQYGELLTTRNNEAYSHIGGLQVKFDSVPLVTIRKTAWKKALKEMEWFLSGNPKCPDELLDWWDGQLSPVGTYLCGYGDQLKSYTSYDYKKHNDLEFDQIQWLIEAIKHSPNSRRLVITTWHPEEMSRITEINKNPNTPTTCHGTLTQFFVRQGTLHMNTTQRSCDLLLGCQHNWIQYWAFLMWLAHRTDLQVGVVTWTFGDAHIYNEPSHIEVANKIIQTQDFQQEPLTMIYNPTSEEFKASDFQIVGKIAEPVTTLRPKLL